MKNSLLFLLGLLLSAVFAGSSRNGETICWTPWCFSSANERVQNIFYTQNFDEYVSKYSAFQNSEKTDEDAETLRDLMHNWVDSFEKTPIEYLNEWL